MWNVTIHNRAARDTRSFLGDAFNCSETSFLGYSAFHRPKPFVVIFVATLIGLDTRYRGKTTNVHGTQGETEL